MSLKPITKLGSNGSGNLNFDNPSGFDTDGFNLFIADFSNNRLIKRSLIGGQFKDKNEDLSLPKDVIYLNGLLYVCDSGNHRVSVHRVSDLKQLKTFGSQGTGNSNFDNPTSITTDGRYLYIADSNNSRIVKYNVNDLSYHSKFGSSGTGNEQLGSGSVTQIAYDKHEKCIYIVDSDVPRVLKWWADFSRKKIYIDSIVESDSTDSSLTGLYGVSVKDHYIYVIEENRIQVFDAGGLVTKSSAGQDGSDLGDIGGGGYIRNYQNYLIFSDLINDKVEFWSEYKPSLSSRDDIPSLENSIFDNFQMITDIPQQGAEIPVDGTLNREKVRFISEKQKTNLRWSYE